MKTKSLVAPQALRRRIKMDEAVKARVEKLFGKQAVELLNREEIPNMSRASFRARVH